MTDPSQRRARTVRISRRKVTPNTWARDKRASIQVVGGTPADLGMHEPLDTPVVVGRGEEANFRLHDDSASRTHIWLGWDESAGEYLVRDLESTNGTLVNGLLIQEPASLKHGDRIELGETLLEFRMADDREIENWEKMEAWLSIDELTGLPNKRRFDAALAQRMRDPDLQGSAMAVLMLDLDNLKAINDRHGHHMGSQTIHEVGQIIGRIVAGRGQGTRFGGDEYTVFLAAHELEAAQQVAEEIRLAVDDLTLMTEEGLPVRTTISIGVAVARCPGSDPDALCREADKALYRAKAKGRNTVSD